MSTINISKLKSKKLPKSEKSYGSILTFLNKDYSLGRKQLSDKKKEAFYKELGTLILSGIDIKTGLELTIRSAKKGKDEILFTDILNKVIGGSSLSNTLESLDMFSQYEYFSIKLGEETGKLGEVLMELSDFFKSKIQQRRKIISALTYPVLVLFTSFAAIFFMIKFVVPMFSDVFKRFGGELPYLTNVILKISAWFDRYFLLTILILLGALGFYFLNRNKLWYLKWSSNFLLKLPMVGDIVQKIYLARLSNTMRLLSSTNTPLLKSLDLVKQMILFYPIQQALEQAEKDILMGKSLSESLSKSSFFPDKFIQIIKIAEEVNKLEFFFGQLSSQYTEEVEYKTQTISSLLEPLIIIILGLTVGVILIAMYLPMFQMSNSF